MTLYLFLGIPAKCNLPVENFHPYGVQSSKAKASRTVFPMHQFSKISLLYDMHFYKNNSSIF